MKNYAEIIATLSPEKRALLALQLKQKGNVANFFQLSFSQQRLWFLDQLEPNSSLYNIPMAIRLTGELKIEALHRSINDIVQRHEALRTTFAELEGEPVQIVHPQLVVDLPVVNLVELPEEERQHTVQKLALEESLQPFDLIRGPLFRASLLKLSGNDYVVLFTMHHIISDGWSMGVLIKELVLLYESHANNRPLTFSKLPIQYADFSRWQRQRLQGEYMQQQIDYWKQQLADKTSVLELPTDFPRTAHQSLRGADHLFKFSRELSHTIKKFNNEEEVTLFMTLLAAFKILLYRYSGQDQISIGSPIANRTRAETEALIGFFVNTLVLRTDLAGDPTVREFLERVKEVTLGAYAHQDLPFEKLVEIVQPERDMSHTPLFQVMFVLQNTPMQKIELSGITLSPIKIESKTAEFELTLSMNETPDGLVGALQYNADLFKAATIERLMDNFRTLIAGMIANPDQRISQIALISEEEQQKIVYNFNDTKIDYPLDQCIHHLIEAQVALTPQQIAVVAGNSCLTYQELNDKANQLAHHLQKIGVGPDMLVGICVERSLEMIVGLLGILKTGAAYVPLDPHYPQERLAYMIEDSGVNVLLTQQRLITKLPSHNALVICLDTDWFLMADQSTTNFQNNAHADNLAYVIYTSGSTGKPKGVLVTQQAVVNHNLTVRDGFQLQADDRVLQFATINFDAAVEEIFPTLMSGATLVLRSSEPMISVLELLRLIEDEQLTVLDLPTAFWHELVYELSLLKKDIPQSVRLVIVGGDRASIERYTMWQKIGGEKVTWLNTYGPTETTVIATQYDPLKANFATNGGSEIPIGRPIANAKAHLLDRNLAPVPVGVPGELYIGGVCVVRGYLNRPDLTAEKFIPDPFSNVPGARLYRSGDLARYLPDGNIEFLGRVDFQVKVRGFRVELSEIETILEQHPFVREAVVQAKDIATRPGEKQLVAYCVSLFANGENGDEKRNDIRVPFPGKATINYNGHELDHLTIEDISNNGACLVTISPLPDWDKVQRVRMALDLPVNADRIFIDSDVVWRRGNRIGVAFREMSPEHKKLIQDTILRVISDPEALIVELRQFLKRNLPEYMVPSIFMLLDKMPRTHSGKVDRQALPEPEASRQELVDTDVAPRTPIEEMLANIWSDLLGINNIGVHRNFFEVGGHSLLATQLISRIRDTFKVELPLRILFEATTIAALAQQIEIATGDARSVTAPQLRAIPRAGTMPLSFGQQRMWFLDQLEPNSPLYNIPDAFRIKGPLNLPALKRSLNEIVRRHEILRTSYQTVDGQAVQLIAAALEIEPQFVDLSALPAEMREREITRVSYEEHRTPFNLAQAPLFRIKLLQESEHEFVVLFTMHHIISDGWSSGILVKEMALLYEAFVNGQASPLPALPIQYADYAYWQREYLKKEVLEQQLDYWKKQLGESVEVLELPTDHPRSPFQTYRGNHLSFSLSEELSAALQKMSRKEGVSLFMLLLASFQTLLHRYSGQAKINVGTPIANRNRSETENLIGFFVNTLVLRTDFGNNPSFRDVLKQVREVALGAYQHQDVPFEKLVDEIQPQRDLSTSPLFQVMFVLQNIPQTKIQSHDLILETYDFENEISQFDLSLIMYEDQQQLKGGFEYNVDLFQQETIERLLAHFNNLLQSIVVNPNKSVTDLQLFSAIEQARMLEEWNQTDVEFPQDSCVHQLFEQQVQRTPAAIAAMADGKMMTYAELNEQANQLAHFLQKQGITPEDHVGISVERSLEMLVGLLGILKAGAAYVPLDPNYPPERLQYMMEDAHINLCITQQKLLDQFPKNGIATFCLDRDWEQIEKERVENPESTVAAQNAAYLIYTSGSTGKPKGVVITHRSIVNHNLAVTTLFKLKPTDRVLQFATINFDAAVEEIFPTLLCGATLVLRDPGALISGLDLLTLIEQKKLTVLDLPTVYWHELVYELTTNEKMIPPSLRLVVLGGDKASHERLAAWTKIGGDNVSLINTYGPTETTIISTAYAPEKKDNEQIAQHDIPIGSPIDNTKAYILDQNMRPVPPGVPGELHIGGVGLARGYYQRPDLTADKFVPDPFSKQPGSRLYKTGDIVRYRSDGKILFVGRVDHQVKIRGFRIELGEIETVLDQYHELKEFVIIVKEESAKVKRLIAYCVAATDESGIDFAKDRESFIARLRNYSKAKLPEYMVPSAFMLLDKLPRTPSGKIDRRALPEPEHIRATTGVEFQEATSPLEKELAKIWSEILGVKNVGVDDNFFELGGDSILSIQVIALANKAGIRLSPRQLFEHPTIAGLAAVAGAGVAIQAEQGFVSGESPLTPIQNWFFEQQLPEPHHWNQAVLFAVDQPLQASLLQRTIDQLLRQHDALRLRFRKENDAWKQDVGSIDEQTPFHHIDLTAVPDHDQKEAIESLAASIQASLDLEHGPIMRVALFDLGAEKPQRLLVVIHHLAVDGVSWRILLEDLQTAYQQLKAGQKITLPPKSTSYKYWAEKLHGYAQSPDFEKEAAYWQTSLNKQSVKLPVDYAHGKNSEASAQVVEAALSEEETSMLLKEVHAVYRTQINDLLLTALVLSFSKMTNGRSLLIEMEGHGREDLFEDVDLSRTVGWFTSIYPVLLDLSKAHTIGDAIKTVKEQLRQMPNHGIGFSILRYLSKNAVIADSMKRLPLPEISFNYLGQFDQGQASAIAFRGATESSGADHSLNGGRSHLLEITSTVTGGRLQVEWTYSQHIHRRATIERFAQAYLTELRAILHHCKSPEAGGVTPSDFPLAKLNQKNLNKVLSKLKEKKTA